MSPLSLVTHGSSAAHHRLLSGANQMSGLVPHEIEQRMMEYIKLFQTPKEPRRNGKSLKTNALPLIYLLIFIYHFYLSTKIT